MHNDKHRRDLERELSILCSIQHDAIISVRALVDEAGANMQQVVPTLFLEFPYCSGGNLGQWLSRSGKRTPWDLQSIARQLFCAVIHLHDRGIIHKDIKPGNILVHGDGRILLSDFDLSKDFAKGASITTSRHLEGTLGYLAPEVQVSLPRLSPVPHL
jgi:serine/threonine protein kinase